MINYDTILRADTELQLSHLEFILHSSTGSKIDIEIQNVYIKIPE